ncbi:MAG: hypothetical protein WAO41_09130 [Candidatus Nanopelagicales bacterium]
MPSKFVISAVVPLALFAFAAPAWASDPAMPPSIPDTTENRYFYDLWFGDTPAMWTPQGTIVADSGFRSYPNGFPYANYGGSLTENALFFGTPDGPAQGATSQMMRNLYGDGVCVTTSGTAPGGPCDLTPSAEYLAQYATQAAAGGHCYGFAAVAAGVFSGLLDPADVAAQTLPSQSQLTEVTQELFLRNWAAQFTVDNSALASLTPSQVVQTLREELSAGVQPYVLSIFGDVDGNPEGHAITPIAVHDRGDGLYDIAVYDNNFPNKTRAVHVDTVANTWAYEMFTNPEGQPTIISGDAQTLSLNITPIDKILPTQPCPVCVGGADGNLVFVDPIPVTAGSLQYQLVETDLSTPLPTADYATLPPFTPINKELQPQPAFDVAPRSGFGFVVDSSTLAEPIALSLSDVSANGVKDVYQPNFPAGAVAAAVFDDGGAFTFGADVPTKPRMDRALSENARHYALVVYGGESVAADNSRYIVMDRENGRALFGDSDALGGSMTVTATLERGSADRKFRATQVSYPAGGNLVLLYGDWKRTNQRPQLWIDNDGDGTLDTQVKMRKVR